MSYHSAKKDPFMKHAAVNTDPLNPRMSADFTSKSYYGLKERNVQHVKIADLKELQAVYELGRKLGEGSFGTVTEVFDNKKNSWAMKTVSKNMTGIKVKLLQQEVQVLKMIEHPHIIYLDKVFESPKYLYLIFEKCRTELTKLYQERKPFVEAIVKNIITDLLDAVAYLHKFGNSRGVVNRNECIEIVHRDIKMENILLGQNPEDPNDEYYIKLTDFGLSISKYGKSFMLHDVCGTLLYMAPEIITKRSYSQTCDMWSVGVILYMLIVGDYPFNAANERDLQQLICSKNLNFEDIKISKEAKNLTQLLLEKDAVKRIRATEALTHPWLRNTKLSMNVEYNILQKMRQWKAEMTVPTGAASDWATPIEALPNRTLSSKEPLTLPKTNIFFDKSKKVQNQKKLPKDQSQVALHRNNTKQQLLK